jgi:MFS family permease
MFDRTESLTTPQAYRIILGGGVGMFLNVAPFLVYTAGVFARPIAQQTGWNATYISSAVGPASLVIGLLCPFVGGIVDHYGARRFTRVSMPLLGLGLISLGLIPRSAGSFTALFVVAGIAAAGQTPVAYTYMLSEWFDERRGLVLGIALAFTGLGIATVPPFAAALIAHYGWRSAYVLLGVIVLATGIPAAHWLVQDPPGDRRRPAGSVTGSSLRQAVGTRPFWVLLSSFFLTAVATGAGVVPFPILLADRGVDPKVAAFIMSVIGIAMIAGRLICGALFDKLFAPRLTAVIFAAPMIGHFLLATGRSAALVIAAAVFLGSALGAEADALAYLTSRAFGIRHFGRLFGVAFSVFSAGAALGAAGLPALAAHLGRYAPANWVSAGCAGVAALLISNIRREDLPFARIGAGRQP